MDTCKGGQLQDDGRGSGIRASAADFSMFPCAGNLGWDGAAVLCIAATNTLLDLSRGLDLASDPV